ncbi:MAG: diaminopimelate epimerase [Candidatus Eisenbacteria bacterium]
MKTIKFTKMSGAGNDFIFLGPEYASLKEWAPAGARYLCRRRLAVGADGLILVEKTSDGIFMHYYNSDGSKPAFCGNGARCLVRFCDAKGVAPSPVTFRSEAGVHTGEVTDCGVRLSVRPPRSIDEAEIQIDGESYAVTHVEAGVPHAVLLVSDTDAIDVDGLGREIRNHPSFGMEGANADFVGAGDGGEFSIRTYERGVERETLACGSGCIAAAHVLREKGMAGDRVRLKVRSGAVLTAEFAPDTTPAVYLSGSADIVYEGEIELSR